MPHPSLVCNLACARPVAWRSLAYCAQLATTLTAISAKILTAILATAACVALAGASSVFAQGGGATVQPSTANAPTIGVTPSSALSVPTSQTKADVIVPPIKRVRPTLSARAQSVAHRAQTDRVTAVQVQPVNGTAASRTPEAVSQARARLAAEPRQGLGAQSGASLAPPPGAIRVSGPTICPVGMALARAAPSSRVRGGSSKGGSRALVNICAPSKLSPSEPSKSSHVHSAKRGHPAKHKS